MCIRLFVRKTGLAKLNYAKEMVILLDFGFKLRSKQLK